MNIFKINAPETRQLCGTLIIKNINVRYEEDDDDYSDYDYGRY